MNAVTVGYVMKRATMMGEEVGSICDDMLRASSRTVLCQAEKARRAGAVAKGP